MDNSKDKTLAEQAVELAESSAVIINELQDKTAALTKELEETKTALATAQSVQKQAEDAAATPVFEKGRVLRTVEGMIQAGFLKKAQQQEVVRAIETKPETSLMLLDKLAERQVRTVPASGRMVTTGTDKEASGPQDVHKQSDDLWEAGVSRLRARLG